MRFISIDLFFTEFLTKLLACKLGESYLPKAECASEILEEIKAVLTKTLNCNLVIMYLALGFYPYYVLLRTLNLVGKSSVNQHEQFNHIRLTDHFPDLHSLQINEELLLQ